MSKTRFVLPVSAVAAAAVALVLWGYVLNGSGRDTQRTTDETAAATHGGNAAAGEQLIVQNGCGACHDIPGIPGPHGTVGPSLKDLAKRQFIAGRLANSPDNLTLWIENPRAIDAGTAMPNVGLTHDEARDVAAYLYDPK